MLWMAYAPGGVKGLSQVTTEVGISFKQLVILVRWFRGLVLVLCQYKGDMLAM